jgi:putative tryptophan/tyrosine transport system substrate-binding protein
MRRREFITLFGGATVTWSLPARAQQADRVRRIGVLMNKAIGDDEARDEVAAFEGALQERGWKLGGTLQINYRWGAGSSDLYRTYAAELLAASPDLLLAAGGTVVGALQRVTHDVPIVFVETTDPVDRGLVASLSRPGGNTTGFIQFEFGISGKWLELLKEIVPQITRVAVIRDPGQFSGVGEVAAIQTIGSSVGVNVSAIDARDVAGIDRAITEFARQPNGGIIVTPSGASIKNRDAIVALVNKHRLPAVYAYRYYLTSGGLIAYGPDTNDQYRRAAGYVDRILRGEMPGDLPVQAPTKYALIINLKTANALGITVPQTLLARADEVIE